MRSRSARKSAGSMRTTTPDALIAFTVAAMAAAPAAAAAAPIGSFLLSRLGGSLPPRPDHALVARDARDPAVHELLHPLPLVRLGRVDVAAGVGDDAVHGEELPRLAPAVAELRQDLERLAVHHVDALVLPVGEVEVALLRVAREGDVPHRAVAQRARRDLLLLHERAVLAEDLDAIVRPVADV